MENDKSISQEEIAEIWQIVRANAAGIKGIQTGFEEVRAQFKETDERLDKLIRETDKRIQETDERLDKRIQETDERLDKRIQETDERLDKRIQQTDSRLDKRIRQLEGLFGNQWGRLIEAMVEPGVLEIFQAREVPVHYLSRRVLAKKNGRHLEIDLLLENTTQIVVVEVKSSFSADDVKDFLADLDEFLQFFPKYKTYQIYGAIAGLDIIEDVSRYAHRRGLFIVNITGDQMVKIINDSSFRPRDFNTTTTDLPPATGH